MEERFLKSVRNCTALICTGIIGVFVLGTNRLSGQLFLACMDLFNVGRKEASLPFTLVLMVRSVSGPITGYLGRKYGAQAVTELGCFLCVVGIGGCTFAKSITGITVLWGIVYGLGTGLGSLLVPHILRDFFHEHYDKAHGYYTSGSGTGGFLLPLLLDTLLFQYGTPGTFLVLSAAMCNCFVATLLLRSLDRGPIMYEKSSRKVFTIESSAELQGNSKPQKSDETIAVELKTPSLDPVVMGLSLKRQQNSNETCLNAENRSVDCEGRPSKLQINSRSNGFKENTMLSKVNKPNVVSKHTLKVKSSVEKNGELNTDEGKDTSNMSRNTVLEVLWIFIDPPFIVIHVTQCLFLFFVQIMFTIVVDFGRDLGFSSDQDVFVLMNLSVSDTIGRLVSGYIMDGGFLSQVNFYGLCFLLLGLLLSAMTFMKSFAMYMIALSATGFIFGGIAMISVGLMFSFIEKEKMIIALPCRYFLYPILGFAIPFLIEFFREGQGSYNGLMFLMAGQSVFCSIVSLLLPASKTLREKWKMRSTVIVYRL